ncbi:MAG: alkaline phosphatase family protein [Chthoniobacterales bacterium]
MRNFSLRCGVLFLLLANASLVAAVSIDANSKVFIILMENHNWSTIRGSASAPYINNTLLPIASSCDQYYNPPGIHPSEPNYLWLEAGTNFGILNDNPPSSNHQSTTNHFVTRLRNAGISWKTYQEDMPVGTCPTTNTPPYYVKHNPFAFFDDVVSSGCTAVMRPLTELPADLANGTVAQYNFITPNICNDMHDSCAPTSNPIRQGDNWLAANLPAILSSSAYQNNGLILITWDEGTGSSDGPIGMIALSPLAKGGGYRSTLHYTHSSTLRTFQKIFGVTPFLGAASTALDLSDLFLPGAIPNGDPQLIAQEVTRAPNGVTTIRWTSQPGINYRCQWRSDLAADSWHSITPDFAGSGSILSWTDDGSQTGGLSATQRFYRVIVP